jgi:F-type H+-transporting ATPase subunit alpha
MPVAKQIVMIFLGTQGLLDSMPVGVIRRFEKEFLEYVENKELQLFQDIEKQKVLSDELKARIKKNAEDFLKLFKS